MSDAHWKIPKKNIIEQLMDKKPIRILQTGSDKQLFYLCTIKGTDDNNKKRQLTITGHTVTQQKERRHNKAKAHKY